MKLLVKLLKWDTNFFGVKVGKSIIETTLINNVFCVEDDTYELIVLEQQDDVDVTVQNYNQTFKETKLMFSKKITGYSDSLEHIMDSDANSIAKEKLYNLALLSGTYSRFLLDKNIGEDNFIAFYKEWVDNSVSKQFADKVFYINKATDLVGFVTVAINDSNAQVGLIAVSEQCQGKGYGAQLLKKVEHYCAEQNIKELRIPTQFKNKQACVFYKKNGYKVYQKKIIKHFWKNDTI